MTSSNLPIDRQDVDDEIPTIILNDDGDIVIPESEEDYYVNED